ncbi:right-handed parallel beta-helix repeat-containing protein [Salinispora arenicola]|uniref:right-handed parallel beta-helix repeat-containing protein n=1 Tax=Salinispora arenicola TaxID=168697 RepID=UPI0003621572|nr:right-handed parallel beta-helix repeat-containing protein [Salinispora arenicola]
MNQQDHTQEPEPDRPGGHRARSRRRWWAIGLAGVTGLALTTVGVAATPIADAVGRAISSDADRPGKPTGDRSATGDSHDDRGKDDKGTRDDKNGETKRKPKGIPVPCDADKLIAAITLANARGGAVLDLAKKCTYLLTANIDDGNGLPTITAPITLNGGKHTTITRAAGVDQFRIVTVGTGGDLTLNHLKITGGQTDGDGGAILVNTGGRLNAKHSTITRNIANGTGGGGGIASAGVTTLEHTTVSRNITSSFAGGIYNPGGQLTVTKSLVKANTANSTGGVASVGSSAVVTITKSVIADNSSQGTVGGLLILNDGVGRVDDTKISGNTAGSFGAIYVDGQITLQKVDITNNTASSGFAGGLFVGADSVAVVDKGLIKGNTSLTNFGGGVYSFSELVMRDTKVIGNQAEQGGGIYNSGGTVTLFNTQVVKNIAVTDGGGIVNNGGTVDLNTATGTIVIKNRPNNCVGNVPDCPA